MCPAVLSRIVNGRIPVLRSHVSLQLVVMSGSCSASEFDADDVRSHECSLLTRTEHRPSTFGECTIAPHLHHQGIAETAIGRVRTLVLRQPEQAEVT